MIELNKFAKIDIQPFYTMEMMERAVALEASGQTVYRLDVGQPSSPAPAPVIAEAIRALQECNFHYCSALGHFELRQAIAQHYHYAYNLTVDPECVVITPGSSLGLYASLLMNFNKGSKIAIASPSYPCYRNVIRALDYELVEIPTTLEQNYLITPESLVACEEDIAGILIGSPNNPTGSMYDASSFAALSTYCESKDIRILSDELYHGVTYEQKAETIRKFNAKATVISGFSKYFSMTGWRVGWMIVPKEHVQPYDNLLQNMILCTSTLTQMAATQAFLSYKELDAQVAVYKKNRDVLYNALYQAGLTHIYKPQGAFYLYLELGDIGLNSMDVCKKLLYEEGVAVAPGLDFAAETTHCSIRVSFCKSPEIIEQAAVKLAAFIKKL